MFLFVTIKRWKRTGQFLDRGSFATEVPRQVIDRNQRLESSPAIAVSVDPFAQLGLH